MKPLFALVLLAGVYGFIIVGKTFNGSDNVFKLPTLVRPVAGTQGAYGVLLTVIGRRLMPLAYY